MDGLDFNLDNLEKKLFSFRDSKSISSTQKEEV